MSLELKPYKGARLKNLPAIRNWQVMVRDGDRACRFFSECFGWQSDDGNSLGYRVVRSAGIEGGIGRCSRAHKTLNTVEANGGSIIIPKQVLPDGDEMAIVSDPEGVSWGIMRIRP